MTTLLEDFGLDDLQLGSAQLSLSRIAQFLEERVLPVASRLDREPAALFDMFESAGELRLLTPKVPQVWNAIHSSDACLSSREYQRLQAMIATYSGALTFLLAQHQSAASFIQASENEAIRAAYLSSMGSGKKRVGVGFSHLRRKKPPALAQKADGGYLFSGEVPWVTGAGLFEEFVGAAVLPSGEAVFGLLPLANSKGDLNGALLVSEPMAMAGMAATRTVSVQLNNWFVAEEKALGLRPAGWLRRRDRVNPLSPMGMILGCATGACRVLTESLRRRQITLDRVKPLLEEKTELLETLEMVLDLPESEHDQKIALRGRAIAFMNKCTQAAMIASGGAANAMDHPARRVYGEALVFSVSGQTNEGAIASLEALIPSHSSDREFVNV